MISFCTAHGLPHTHIRPLFGCQLAPMTKHASFGPSDVANMPAPHGQCMVCRFKGVPKRSVFISVYISLSVLQMFLMAMSASSSPGYEIFGMDGMGQSAVSGGGTLMGLVPCAGTQPVLQSPIA